jgi:carbon monoxide dehydrogenase subunit G
MASGQAEIEINGTPDAVWAVIGEFGGIDTWMPGIDSCRVEGETRIIGAGSMSITERLIARDEQNRQITYSVVDGVPLDSHQATITVIPKGAVSQVTWAVEATPDAMGDMMVKTYQGALGALKAKIES